MDRDATIRKRARQGELQSALASEYGLTRQRVSQIIRRGIKPKQRRKTKKSNYAAIIDRLINERGNRCQYCGSFFDDRHLKPLSRSLDHRIPKMHGGSDDEENLMLVCRSCNSIKANRSLEMAKNSIALKVIGWPNFTQEQVDWLRKKQFDLSEYDSFTFYYLQQMPLTGN